MVQIIEKNCTKEQYNSFLSLFSAHGRDFFKIFQMAIDVLIFSNKNNMQSNLAEVYLSTTDDKYHFLLQLQQQLLPSNWDAILEIVQKKPPEWIETFQTNWMKVYN